MYMYMKDIANIIWKEIKTDHDLISTEDSGCVCSNFLVIVETVMFVTSDIMHCHSSGFKLKCFIYHSLCTTCIHGIYKVVALLYYLMFKCNLKNHDYEIMRMFINVCGTVTVQPPHIHIFQVTSRFIYVSYRYKSEIVVPDFLCNLKHNDLNSFRVIEIPFVIWSDCHLKLISLWTFFINSFHSFLSIDTQRIKFLYVILLCLFTCNLILLPSFYSIGTDMPHWIYQILFGIYIVKKPFLFENLSI